MHFKQHATRFYAALFYPAAKAPGLKRTVLVYIFRGELPIDFMLTWVLDRPLKKGDVYSIQVITNN